VDWSSQTTVTLEKLQDDIANAELLSNPYGWLASLDSTMSANPEPTSSHIPAWKKLGLKLKFAKEEPDDDVKHQDTRDESANSKRRKLADVSNPASIETIPTETPLKKLKRTKTKKDKTALAPNGDDLSAANGDEAVTSPVADLVTPRANRKSVSFTPETKTQDGEGVKQLYNTWFDKQIALDPSFDPTSVSPALRSIEATTTTSDEAASHLKLASTAKVTSDSLPSAKKPKKTKREKILKKPDKSSRIPPPSPHPALTYLTTHHTFPTTWKFSKPHQNHLLKHLFSFDHIPTSYDSALLRYLRGLQGSARSRIRQEALAIRSGDAKWLSSEPIESEKMDQETDAQCIARRKRDYDAAVARIKQQLRDIEDEREDKEYEMLGEKEAWEQRARKRRRAETVLWGVGEEEEVVKVVTAPPMHPVLGNSRPAAGGPATIQSRGMGGVEQISVGGIAKGSAGKKIVFDDDKENGVQETRGRDAVNGTQKVESTGGVNGVRKKKRGHRRPRTGVPDDDSSSSESSSSSSSEDSEDAARKEKLKQQQKKKGIWGNMMSLSSSSDSSSGSGTSSSEESDSE